jgi:integrase
MANKEQWANINDMAKRLLLMSDIERLSFMNRVNDVCRDLKEQSILAFFYIYGLRPEELTKMLKSDFVEKDGELIAKIPTAKTNIQKDIMKERIIVLDIEQTPFLFIIKKFLDSIPLSDFPLYPGIKHPTGFNRTIEKLEKRYFQTFGEEICLSPYVFRKFRISYLLSNGATTLDILAWKGGTSIASVEQSYSFFKPVIKFKTSIR